MTNPFAPASPATSFRRLAPGERGRLLPEHFLRLDSEDRRQCRDHGDQERRAQPEAISRKRQQRYRAHRHGKYTPARIGEVEAE